MYCTLMCLGYWGVEIPAELWNYIVSALGVGLTLFLLVFFVYIFRLFGLRKAGVETSELEKVMKELLEEIRGLRRDIEELRKEMRE